MLKSINVFFESKRLMKMDRGLNSGVQFRSVATQPDGTERVNGYQVECDDHDDRPWAGGIYEEASRGWLYPMSCNPKAAKFNKRGEWNRIRVEAVGSTIRTFINGVSFANLVDAGRSEGFIALQVHGIGNNEALDGKEIRWKNIRILTEEPEKYMKSDVELAPEVSYLENALTPSSRLGGHLVSGHVDGVGKVLSRTEEARSFRFVVSVPDELVRYVARKGSICIDGVSLTVNGVQDDRFDVNIVPHTLEATNLREWTPGRHVKLEDDIVARDLETRLER